MIVNSTSDVIDKDENKRGLNLEPCGTPQVVSHINEECPSCSTNYLQWHKYELNNEGLNY